MIPKLMPVSAVTRRPVVGDTKIAGCHQLTENFNKSIYFKLIQLLSLKLLNTQKLPLASIIIPQSNQRRTQNGMKYRTYNAGPYHSDQHKWQD